MYKFNISLRQIFFLSIALILPAFILLLPTVAFAQIGQIWDNDAICSGVDCQFCHLIALANRIMQFTVAFCMILAAAGIVYGGFLYVTAAGRTGQLDKARRALTSVLIGFTFVLSAWIIVATISHALLDDGKLPWEGLDECVEPTDAEPTDVGGSGSDGDLTAADGDGEEDYDSTEPSEVPEGANHDRFIDNSPGEGKHGYVPENEFETRDQLAEHNIGINDSYECSEINTDKCRTYVGGLEKEQIAGVTRMADATGGLTITGAAEQGGHSDGSTHYTGNSVDVRPTPEVEQYINDNRDEFKEVLNEGDHYHLEFK